MTTYTTTSVPSTVDATPITMYAWQPSDGVASSLTWSPSASNFAVNGPTCRCSCSGTPWEDRSRSRRLQLFPGARHETFNETNRDEVTGYVVDWLDRRTAKGAGPVDSR
jgi:hypothetical protein